MNILDLTKPGNINPEAGELSSFVAANISRYNGYNKTIKISSLIGAFNAWFEYEYPSKKLDLVIVDASCRVLC
jgi:hypothetical protein